MKNGLLSTASARGAQHLSLVIYRGAHKAKYITCCKKASMQMSFVSVSHLHCCITYAQPVHHRRGVCWLHMLLLLLLLLTARRQWALRVHLAVALDRVCIFRRSARTKHTTCIFKCICKNAVRAKVWGSCWRTKCTLCYSIDQRVHMTIKIHQFGCTRERN